MAHCVVTKQIKILHCLNFSITISQNIFFQCLHLECVGDRQNIDDETIAELESRLDQFKFWKDIFTWFDDTLRGRRQF